MNRSTQPVTEKGVRSLGFTGDHFRLASEWVGGVALCFRFITGEESVAWLQYRRPLNPGMQEVVNIPLPYPKRMGQVFDLLNGLGIEFPGEECHAEAEMTRRFANLQQARAAIVQRIGTWKKGSPGVPPSAVDCPVCNKPNALRFSRAGSNGHIHAKCQTPGCVAWVE